MLKSIAIGLIATLFASPLMAASLSIQSIDGTWQNADPGVTGVGTSDIRWGKSSKKHGKQSGYDFDAAGDLTVDHETSFVLGTFTHLNFPIRQPVLTSVDLSFSFMVDGLADAITTVFSFDHWETPNQATECANGGKPGAGVNNGYGCADRVMATVNNAQAKMFEIAGVTYALDITGFQYDDEFFTEFWTRENQTNSAQLLGSFRVVPSEVPLPATGLLLLGGLAGLAMARRRKT